MREYEYVPSERQIYMLKGDEGEEWFWEITTFQTKDDRAFGVAKELTREINTRVIEISEMNLTETMLKKCNELMDKLYQKVNK